MRLRIARHHLLSELNRISPPVRRAAQWGAYARSMLELRELGVVNPALCTSLAVRSLKCCPARAVALWRGGDGLRMRRHYQTNNDSVTSEALD